MSVNEIAPIDYGTLAASRITQQYRDKPLFMELVSSLASAIKDSLETPAANLFNALDIDLMEGHNLDVIGDIVGQSRTIFNYDDLVFFGFSDATDAGTLVDGVDGLGGFGDVTDTGVGYRLTGEEESGTTISGKVLLQDPEYRLFIKARILKNYSDGTQDTLIAAIKQLFPQIEQVLVEESPMSLAISVLGNLNHNDTEFITHGDVIPRNTGVGISGVTTHKMLGFNGTTASVSLGKIAQIGTADFEISFSIKTGQAWATILTSEYDSGYSPSYAISIQDGILCFGYSAEATISPLTVVNSGLYIADDTVKTCSIRGVGDVIYFKAGSLTSTGSCAGRGYADTDDILYIGNTTQGAILPLIITRKSDSKKFYYGIQPGSPRWADNADPDNSTWVLLEGVWRVRTFENGQSTVADLLENTALIPPKTGWENGTEFEYQSALKGILFDLIISVGSSQVGHWRMIDSTGTSLADISGNSHTGTITDPAWVTSLNATL